MSYQDTDPGGGCGGLMIIISGITIVLWVTGAIIGSYADPPNEEATIESPYAPSTTGK